MFATELKNVKRVRISARKKQKNAEVFFDGSGKVLDAFRGGIFQFIITYTHPYDLEKPSSSETPRATPIVEDVSYILKTIDYPNYPNR